jgi:hypothetical protein
VAREPSKQLEARVSRRSGDTDPDRRIVIHRKDYLYRTARSMSM